MYKPGNNNVYRINKNVREEICIVGDYIYFARGYDNVMLCRVHVDEDLVARDADGDYCDTKLNVKVIAEDNIENIAYAGDSIYYKTYNEIDDIGYSYIYKYEYQTETITKMDLEPGHSLSAFEAYEDLLCILDDRGRITIYNTMDNTSKVFCEEELYRLPEDFHAENFQGIVTGSLDFNPGFAFSDGWIYVSCNSYGGTLGRIKLTDLSYERLIIHPDDEYMGSIAFTVTNENIIFDGDDMWKYFEKEFGKEMPSGNNVFSLSLHGDKIQSDFIYFKGLASDIDSKFLPIGNRIINSNEDGVFLLNAQNGTSKKWFDSPTKVSDIAVTEAYVFIGAYGDIYRVPREIFNKGGFDLGEYLFHDSEYSKIEEEFSF